VTQTTVLLVAGAVSLALMGTGLVWLFVKRRRRPENRPLTARTSLEMTCTVCKRELVFGRNEMADLSPPERALVVREMPQTVGRPLAEYVCPHCRAAHCFATDTQRPEWLGVNLYEPQQSTPDCLLCGRDVRPAPWRKGKYDGRLAEAPVLPRDMGVICSSCAGVFCVGCCRASGRKAGRPDALVCPRCARETLDQAYHME